MSSKLAKQRKRLARRGLSNEQANSIVVAINKHHQDRLAAIRGYASEAAEAAYRKMQDDYIPQVQADLIAYIFAFLRCERGYGRARLIRFMHDYNDFFDCMVRGGVRANEIRQMLLNETGFDLAKELQRCDMESQKKQAEIDENMKRLGVTA